jgi:hypothetical protein
MLDGKVLRALKMSHEKQSRNAHSKWKLLRSQTGGAAPLTLVYSLPMTEKSKHIYAIFCWANAAEIPPRRLTAKFFAQRETFFFFLPSQAQRIRLFGISVSRVTTAMFN